MRLFGSGCGSGALLLTMFMNMHVVIKDRTRKTYLDEIWTAKNIYARIYIYIVFQFVGFNHEEDICILI